VVDAELLLYLRELIVEGGFHRIVEVSDDNVWLSDRVLFC
jgi:hypothetical protein